MLTQEPRFRQVATYLLGAGKAVTASSERAEREQGDSLGVDFRMRVAHLLPDDRFELIPDEGAHYSQRLFWLEDLLRPKADGPGIAKRIRQILPGHISLRWFDEAYNEIFGEEGPPDARDCWRPEEIIEAADALLEGLRLRGADLPEYFGFREPTGRGAGGYRMFVGGQRYLVRGGWGRCAAVLTDDHGNPALRAGEEIDLRGERSIRAHAVFIPLDRRRLDEDTSGPEMTVVIERETCADHFRPDLEAMLRVARLAAATGNRVFTSID